MIDLHYLRENTEVVARTLALRGYSFDMQRFSELESQRKDAHIKTQELQNQRNSMSKQIGDAKRQGQDTTELMSKVEGLGVMLKTREAELDLIQNQMHEFLADVPNLLHGSVPVGDSEAFNAEVKSFGTVPSFDFAPKEHYDLATGLMDFATAAKMSGARFVVLSDALARLHRALAQFMLNTHIDKHGYSEQYVPLLVKSDTMFGTGQFPKFMEDQFATAHDLWIIPTGEVPLTNLVRDQIIEADELPLKFVAHTPCFRKESGSYGKDTKGMLRQHQFDKIELVHITKPDDSYKALDELLSHAENIMQALQLPYRVMNLCSADLGFSAAKTYDIEAWLPGQNCYREISSCSNTEAFQARRMQARWRNPVTKKAEPVHTINGSGLAVGRTLIAVLENYQQADGSIVVPDVLHPYMGGVTKLEA